MSWISDVRSEVHRLKCTPKDLRKFAYIVGSVFVLIGGEGFLKHWHPAAVTVLWLVGLILLCCGLVCPQRLRRIYMVWMGFAFALGWVVSRAILFFLFYLVITPIGLAARLFGKKFIDTDFLKRRETYWVEKGNSKKIDYEKLF